MKKEKLTMEQLDVIARAFLSIASKNEKGRELLRMLAAEDFIKGASVINQLPTDMAESFTEALNEVYETLIKPDGKEFQG